METWPIIKLTLGHCGGAIIVGGAFAGTAWLYGALFPGVAVQWWINKIEFMLVVISLTALALMFLSSLSRIALNTIIRVWKGFPHDNVQSVLA